MLIKIRHPKFSGVELRDGSLVIHSMQGKARVLLESVDDVAVVVQGDLVRIVGFVDKAYAWYLSGTGDFHSERIEFDQPYSGGGKLIDDGHGHSHLFYFVKQAVGKGMQLRHQTFTDQWSIPQVVSMNVFAERSSYNASWNNDGYLHLVYCDHNDGRLLYRVYDLNQRLWSGAVVFSEAKSSLPQFIPTADRLYLFWQEENEKNVLRVRHKTEQWSPTGQVSSGDGHVSNVGYGVRQGEWKVFWGEGGRFFAAPFGHWSERKEVSRDGYDYAWVVEERQMIATYEPKGGQQESAQIAPVAEGSAETKESKTQVKAEPRMEPETKPEPQDETDTKPTTKDREQVRRETEEARLQAAFMEQAFRTLQEWEQVREEMTVWKRELKPPESVDLTPFMTRIERLERRLLTLQQSQEKTNKLWEDHVARVDQGIARINRRLADLEDVEKDKPPSLWKRVLGRA